MVVWLVVGLGEAVVEEGRGGREKAERPGVRVVRDIGV